MMAAKKFNIMETMNRAAQAEMEHNDDSKIRAEMSIEKLSVFDLIPSEENFYAMTSIDELKESIELAGRVLQNLLVVPLSDGKYKILSGHRRCAASISLVNEGKKSFEFVPCSVERPEGDQEAQEIREEIILITSNSQREKTAWEKMEEVRRIRSLVEKIRENEKVEGNTRKCIADTLNTSTTQVARYDAIHNNLAPAFMGEFKEGGINLSTAYELSGLSLDEQKEAFEEYKGKEGITTKEVKSIKERKKKEKTSSTEKEKLDWTVARLKHLAKQESGEIVFTPSDIEALEIAIKLIEGK